VGTSIFAPVVMTVPAGVCSGQSNVPWIESSTLEIRPADRRSERCALGEMTLGVVG
jgi:hypothetical protein